MKRFLVFIFLLVAVFSGCQAKSDAKDKFTLPLTVVASLDNNEGQFISEISADECIVSFGEKHVLSGTTLRFTEGENTATVGDIFTRTVKKGTFPAQEALIKAIYLISSTETDGIYENGKTRYTIDEMKILVYYDENSNSITRIETEESARRFAFVIASIESHDTQSKSAGTP